MSEVILETEDEEYYEIFSSSLFDGKLKKKPTEEEESDEWQ